LAGTRALPCSELRLAAMLLVDVVGFTAMGDEAVRVGIIGAEKLAETINLWLGGIFRTIRACDGDIYVVAGDAILAIWFTGNGCHEADAVAAALRAALTVQTRAQDRASGGALRVRASVCVGPVRSFEVGGRGDEWHGVLAGEVLTELGALNRQGAPGTVLASSAAWRLVSGRAAGTRRTSGAIQVTAVSVERVASMGQPVSGSIPPRRLEALVPRMVADWMDAGLDITRVGQFRTITVMFILVEGLEPGSAASLDVLQSAVGAAQSACADLQGSIYQVLGDDQGVSIVAAYGLPPMSHRDDAARAVTTGFLLQRTVGELGSTTSIGIATGRAFCCVYGDGDRRQFALVGPVMNLGARLMQARQGIVCDAETIAAARHHHRLEVRELAPLILKGKPAPVVCYTPIEPPIREDLTLDRGRSAASLVGRTEELARIEEALESLRAGRGGVVVIEGEPGIGKSVVIAGTLSNAQSRNVRSLAGFSDDIEQSTPFFPWRSIFTDVFGIAGLNVPAATERVTFELGHDAPFAPLLNPLFSLRLAETAETIRLSAVARAETTRRILLERLARYVATTPTLVVLEDLHWFDSGSWSLLCSVAEAGLPILLAATTRPLGTDVEVYSRFLAAPRCQHLVLAGLSAAETSHVVARALGATETAPDVAAFVHARTAGNPFFVGELAKVLREAGTLLVVGGRAVFSPEVLLAGSDLDGALEARGIPATLEGTIVTRVDRLSRAQQTVIRAASVVGRTFDLAALSAALPDGARATLGRDVEALLQEGLLAPAHGLPAPGYEFRHVLLRDVVYHGLSFAERRLLHKTVALWMEQTAEGSAGMLDTLLGHHFREAGEIEPAVRYLARAGESAVKSYSNKEAATLLGSAIALEQEKRTSGSAERRGALELLLGRAYLALSRNTESKRCSETGLALVGNRIPSSAARLLLGVVGEITRQFLYRSLPRVRGIVKESERATLRASAIALEGLAEIFFYDGDGLKCLYASLRMLNLAERLGPSPELARAYAAVSGITGLLRLPGVAASYRRLSLEMLTTIDDPGAAAWALNLLAISRMGTGDWEDALVLYRRTSEIADPLGERRRSMDAIEGCAIVAACRGDWHTALAGVEQMRLHAARDADQRYLLLAYREQAFLELQNGRLEEAERILPLIKAEIDRGMKAEELVTRQDYHGVAGTLALERGDAARAAAEADAGLAVSAGLSGSGSFANRYWTLFLIGRVYLIRWRCHDVRGQDEDCSRKARTAYRLLKRLARAHPIAEPSALLIRGGSEWLIGRRDRARGYWRRALAVASALGMRYEAALARSELLRSESPENPSIPAVGGLPLLETLSGTQLASESSIRV
jgi:tetratricopeptide (TPR) repeat protein